MEKIEPLERINIFQSSDFRDKINSIIDAVNDMMEVFGVSGGEGVSDETRSDLGIPVKLTAKTASGLWEFEEQVWDDSSSTYITKAGGLNHTDLGEARAVAKDLDALSILPLVNAVVYIYPGVARGPGGVTTWEFSPPIVGVCFPVTMSQTGGVAGDSTTQCSYTYTVNSLDGTELATAVNPGAGTHKHQRPAVGEMMAATHGIAYYDNPDDTSGNFIIAQCNEQIEQEAC